MMFMRAASALPLKNEKEVPVSASPACILRTSGGKLLNNAAKTGNPPIFVRVIIPSMLMSRVSGSK
jgi:hypothetical protein